MSTSKYLLVIIFAFVCDILLLQVLLLVDIRYLIAVSLSFSFARIISYILNRHFVFNARGDSVIKSAWRFGAISLLGLGATVSLVYLLVQYMDVYPVFARILVGGVIIVLGFFANKFFVFKKRA